MKGSRKITVLIILSFIIAIGSLITSYSYLNREDGIVVINEDIYNIEYKLNNYVTSSESISFNGSPTINENEISFSLGLDTIGSCGEIFFDINNIGDYDAIYNGIEITGLEEYSNNVSISLVGIEKGETIESGISKTNIYLKISYDNLIEGEITNINLNNIRVKVNISRVGE